jgi:hypothetical protein
VSEVCLLAALAGTWVVLAAVGAVGAVVAVVAVVPTRADYMSQSACLGVLLGGM